MGQGCSRADFEDGELNMKDLYGLRSEDIDMLKQAGYGDDIFYVGNYGISDVTGEQLFFISFYTSEQKNKAYKYLYESK